MYHECCKKATTNCARQILYRMDVKHVLCGAQDGIKQTEVDSFVAQQFRQADAGGLGRVSPQDFSTYYQAIALPKARLELRSSLGLEAESKQLAACACTF